MIRKYWIIILISALLLAGFGSTLLTGYFVAQRTIQEEIHQNTLPLTSDNIYSEIQKDLVLSIHISSQMAHDTFVKEWVVSGEKEPQRMIRYLSEIQNRFKTVTAFFVSDITHNYYHPDGIIKKVSRDDPGDSWYFRSRSLPAPYEINIDADTADPSRMTIFVNYQVHDFKGELIGVTGVGLELSQVQSVLNAYQGKYNSTVFFVDNAGKTVLHADDFAFPLDLHHWKGFSTRALNILTTPGASFEYKVDGRSYLVNSRFIPEFNLFLVILKSTDDMEQVLGSRLKQNFVIGMLITLSVIAIVSILLRRYHQNLEKLASIDPLTGAFNRNAFSLIFSHTIKQKHRSGDPLSLMLVDIDNFKEVNDQHGHQMGDLVLKDISRTILGVIREADVFCRWGGEEFVILFANCSIDKAVQVAEKIKEACSSLEIGPYGKPLRITVSAGVVEHRADESLEEMIVRADKLMYTAKKQGKNRVVS
ncbi:sensor domain-containing diguanylate cyclase [Desulfonatronovibrio hydrogenovorans]|uniref:sensor domain-containing diguanylate cyclase n=1 Tax=Desulfonatronovibrio hydrogenovorans TaxID=53245 RepID=UPI00049220D9|nr:sensor domain-containing diguanylate cyclase [Desulfonatronovibrio hydrogenovorans]